jgi:hypothetical protein
MSQIIYPPDIQIEEAKILDLLANGQTLAKACESVGLSTGQFMQRLPNRTSLSHAFVCARDAGAEVLADSLLGLTDTEADVNRARLKSDNIKWILSRRHAAKFGDRIDVNVNATVDLTSAISEARNRLRPVRDQEPDIIDVTPIESGLAINTLPDTPSNESPIGAQMPDIFG